MEFVAQGINPSKYAQEAVPNCETYLKEYLPDDYDDDGNETLVVVSLVLEIQGDSTK